MKIEEICEYLNELGILNIKYFKNHPFCLFKKINNK